MSRTCGLLLLPEADVISLVSDTDVMDLGKRFEEATAYASFSVASLEPHKRYPIIRAKRLSTKFGMSVVFTLRCSDDPIVQVFLPQRYSDVVTDADIQSINSECVDLNIVNKGVCESSKAYILVDVPEINISSPPPCSLVGDVSKGRTVRFGTNRTW